MLDTEYVTGDLLSLHTAFSTTGTNELAGGSYARQPITWSAAAARAKTSTGTINVPVPAGASVAWMGVWNAAGTVFKGMMANGGFERTFQIGVTPNTILCEGHGLANDDRVVFTGTPPTGLTEGTHYFVTGVTAGDPDTFTVSATQGGAAIDITGQQAAHCVVSKLVIEVYAGAGTHQVTSVTQRL
jgi:hypothetical protein